MNNTEVLLKLQLFHDYNFSFCFKYFVISGPQRLSDEGHRSPDVVVHVRVPLEKEVPLTLVIEERKLLEEKPEFPELTEVRLLCSVVHLEQSGSSAGSVCAE